MSIAWKSQAFTMKQKWKSIDNNMRRMRLDRSPAVPRNIEEYAKHVAEWAKEEADTRDSQIATGYADVDMRTQLGRDRFKVFDNHVYAGGRCGVLGLKTIWALNWTPEPDHPEVRWPDSQEFKEEGDERHTSNFGRFLPLLRWPGNETVNWKQRPRLIEYDLDKVMLVPRKCSVVIDHLYGFELELDLNGFPYDDDELNGGEEAIAFHLDESSENVKNATLRKIEDFLQFQRLYSAQIYGTTGESTLSSRKLVDINSREVASAPATGSGDKKLAGEHTDEVDVQAAAGTQGNRGQARSFNFNPRACEFISILNSPSPSEETSPVEYSPVTPNAVPLDTFAIINQINSRHTARFVNQAGLNSNDSRALVLAQSTDATYDTPYGFGSYVYGHPSAGFRQNILNQSYKPHRQGSHGAIGSERHSSEGTLIARDEYTRTSSTYGDDDDVDCASFRTAIQHRDSENVSPHTIPNNLALMKIGPDSEDSDESQQREESEDKGGPISLAQLVDSSVPDNEEDDFF